MGRERAGSLWYDKNGDLYGRISWKGADGKRKERKRKAGSGTKREARQHIQDLLNEQDEEQEELEKEKTDKDDESTFDAATLTFKQLTDKPRRSGMSASAAKPRRRRL